MKSGDRTAPRSRDMTRAGLMQRITDYMSSGGLFNPEMAIHDEVRDLLIDCRAALAGGAWLEHEPVWIGYAQQVKAGDYRLWLMQTDLDPAEIHSNGGQLFRLYRGTENIAKINEKGIA